MQRLKEKIQEYKYSLKRKAFMKSYFPNIGIIKEEEDKIICYVNQELLLQYLEENRNTIRCWGVNRMYEDAKQEADYYQLDKPVYYIFDGIRFYDTKFDSSYNNIMIFRNCIFNGEICFSYVNKVILENNTYNSCLKKSNHQGDFLKGTIEELIIQNDHLVNQFKSLDNSQDFGINLTTDKLIIMNSTMVAENEGQIYIKAKEANFMDSILEAPEMYLDLDTITYANSLLKSSKGIIIENRNRNRDCLKFYKVDSPYVFYNGMEIINKEREERKQTKENLTKARIPLVQLFTNLQNKSNQEIVEQYLREEADQPISRVLKIGE